jgi:hypothetical protein
MLKILGRKGARKQRERNGPRHPCQIWDRGEFGVKSLRIEPAPLRAERHYREVLLEADSSFGYWVAMIGQVGSGLIH